MRSAPSDNQFLEIKNESIKFGDLADWTTWLHGFLNRDKNGFTTENFGFADGISDPVFKAAVPKPPPGQTVAALNTFNPDAD